jgi:hypothetical protein
MLKLYSSCSFTHPGLDALPGLAADERLTAAEVPSASRSGFPRAAPT